SRLLSVSPGFFDTIGIPLLAGRDIALREWEPKSSAVVVNEAFARRFFPGENPIGKRFDPGGGMREIVGLAGDAKYDEIRGSPPATVYSPLRGRGSATLTVRCNDCERIA